MVNHMQTDLVKMLSFLSVTLSIILALSTSSVFALTIDPVYNQGTYSDAVTGDNEFIDNNGKHRWFVDDGADDYYTDVYERPTADMFDNNVAVASKLSGPDANRSADVDTTKTYSATDEYYGYLDIKQAKWGYEGSYMYFQIELNSAAERYSDGKADFEVFGASSVYSIRLGEDENASNSILLRADGQANFGNTYKANKTYGFWDKDGDVGGPGGILTTNEGTITGYENDVIESDGKLKDTGSEVLFSRINCKDKADCPDAPIVEFAFDYVKYNLESKHTITPEDIKYLVFEANRGYKDNSVYLWNDENSFSEAGSPYLGTDYGNIDELDNLQALNLQPIPEPSTLILLGGGIMGLIGFRKKYMKY